MINSQLFDFKVGQIWQIAVLFLKMGNSSGIYWGQRKIKFIFFYCKCIFIWGKCRPSGSRYPEFRRLYIDRNRDAFSSVAQLCPTVCKPVECSMPGFPAHHQIA